MSSSSDNQAERMTAYLDAELEASEAEAFERYLEDEPQARSELEDLRKVMQLVGKLGAVEAPPDFVEKVARKVRRRATFDRDGGGLLGLVTLPFQVICIIVILTIAALNMMAQLEAQPQAVERDAAAEADDEAEQADDAPPPRPIVP
jgi:anti-sigma factor RsiW